MRRVGTSPGPETVTDRGIDHHPGVQEAESADLLQAPSHLESHFHGLVRAEFLDVDAMCSVVRDWHLDFRPLSKSASASCVGRVIQSQGAGVFFGYARFVVNLDQRGAPPPGCVTFVVLEDTLRRLWWRGHDVSSDTVLVFPEGAELHSISGIDFAIHTVSIESKLCEEISGALGLEVSPGKTPPEVFDPPVDVLAPLRRSLRFLKDPFIRPTNAAMRSIAETLVKAWSEARDEVRRGSDRNGSDRTMRKALERLGGSDWPALTPSDLCTYAGVSERTLQNAFRDRFGVTPAAFLKARRLGAVNAMLKSGDEAGVSVGDAAAQFGFWHSGQFAADYRRAFGELPSQTFERSRDWPKGMG